MGYLTLLKLVDPNDNQIDETEFMKWFDGKGEEFWDDHGLAPTGKFEDQDDEAEVRAVLPGKIHEFNNGDFIDNEGCVGHIMASVNMIGQYLKEEKGAKDSSFVEMYSDTNILLVK